MRTQTRDTQQSVTPDRALTLLRDGNQRFVANLRAHRNLLEQVNETSEGQFPFGVILSCIDSRTSAELIFDQGLGDIFSIRLAGNVVNSDVLGSMEFACRIAGSKIVVVLGHTACGAIKGACDQVQLGNLTTLLNKIQPAVYLERTTTGDRSSKNVQFVRNVTELQVRSSVENVVENSAVLRGMIEAGEIGLIGAIYSVEDGTVEFFEDTYMCGSIKHFSLRPPGTSRDTPQET